MTDEDKRGVGQPNPPPGLFEQRDPRLAFEHRKLLRDRRRGELQRVRDRGDRAPLVQLVEETQAM